MNVPIFRLYAFFLVLFTVLIGFVALGGLRRALAAQNENKRVVLEEQRIKRGVIRARDGEVLAGSVRALQRPLRSPLQPADASSRWRWLRLGAVRPGRPRAAVQRRADGPQGRAGEHHRLAGGEGSRRRRPRTTLDPKAQKVANDALQGRGGAVVALDVKTAAVRVQLAGTPSFNPNRPAAARPSTPRPRACIRRARR